MRTGEMLICHFVCTNVQIRVFISSKYEILQNKLIMKQVQVELLVSSINQVL